MKKSIIMTLLAVAAATTLQGQILKVNQVEQVQIPAQENVTNQAVAISPHGDYMLLSSDTRQGLTRLDLTNGTVTTLTKAAGAGSDVHIVSDGQQVVYSEVSYKDKKRQQALKSIDMQSLKQKTIVKPTRDLQGFTTDQSAAVAVQNDKVNTYSLSKGAAASLGQPILTKYQLKLYIISDGQAHQFAPNGVNEHYIWGSLSPGGDKVLYYVSGQGAFVCDVDGNNVIAMGDITAPKWWDDNTIVGMDEVDDEYQVIQSSIIARTLDGRQQTLTGNDMVATYPIPCQQAGKIAFSTPDGKIYLISVE